ncbi:MAG: thioredoxin family protein, partial [Lutibacter sp.]|nr:thioredoxin family protein [Lutibacter sp.]
MNNTLINNSLNKGISYLAYRTLIKDLLIQEKSTGNEQSDDLLNYSILNNKRMDRLDKTL